MFGKFSMHGVSKTALSDEQKEAKRLERQKKQERFVKVRDIVLRKSAEGQFDDEGLELTAAVLTKNPDLYIFWTYRKRTILSLVSRSDCSSAVAAASDIHSDEKPLEDKKIDIEGYYKNELALTEECLRDNPKSYAAWYHRQWILQRYFLLSSKSADLLKSELRHCAEALKFDERNFHCWDHRRFVCALASVSKTEELNFSKTKIDENFSNYSAWHYRSALLPHLYPPVKDDLILRLEESKLKEELTYAQNAFFTDPEDQSAWFYHFWLFRPMESASEKLALRYLYADLSTPAMVILVFNRSVNLKSRKSPVQLLADDTFDLSSGWSTPDGSRSCSIWMKTLTSEESKELSSKKSLKVFVEGIAVDDVSILSLTSDCQSLFEYFIPKNSMDHIIATLQPPLPEAFRVALEESMLACRELKSLVEPTSNKWPSLTEILSMRSLDLLKYESEIHSGLDSLMQVDPRKRTYYADLKSKYIVEGRLLKCAIDGITIRSLQLNGLGITTLPSLTTIMLLIGVSYLNLDNNYLTSTAPLGYLLTLRRLSLDGNELTDTKGLGNLPKLEYLSLASNRLAGVDSLSPLKESGRLEKLVLTGNPICKNEGVESILTFLGKSMDLFSATM